MSKHTPGPWQVIPEKRGFVIAALDDCYDVASVRDIGNQDNRANALLIAAAPDLLEALQELVPLLEATLLVTGTPEPDSVGYRARAAIAKATGEAQ